MTRRKGKGRGRGKGKGKGNNEETSQALGANANQTEQKVSKPHGSTEVVEPEKKRKESEVCDEEVATMKKTKHEQPTPMNPQQPQPEPKPENTEALAPEAIAPPDKPGPKRKSAAKQVSGEELQTLWAAKDFGLAECELFF